MTTDNDSVRKDFEQTMAALFGIWHGVNSDPLTWHRRPDGSYLNGLLQQHFATWQASRERYVPSITDLERRNGELEKDAARYQWLKGSVSERLTNNSLRNEFSEHKCEYIFPQLIAWADFCGPISFDDAIDMRIDEALTRTKEQ